MGHSVDGFKQNTFGVIYLMTFLEGLIIHFGLFRHYRKYLLSRMIGKIMFHGECCDMCDIYMLNVLCEADSPNPNRSTIYTANLTLYTTLYMTNNSFSNSTYSYNPPRRIKGRMCGFSFSCDNPNDVRPQKYIVSTTSHLSELESRRPLQLRRRYRRPVLFLFAASHKKGPNWPKNNFDGRWFNFRIIKLMGQSLDFN